MGFLDKAKEKATKLVEQTKEKVDDVKDKRKAGDLLEDLGRITYRQHTSRGDAGDADAIAKLVTELQALEAEGTDGILAKKAEAPAADAPSAGAPLAPPPPPGAPMPAPTNDAPPSFPTPQ